MKLEIKQPEFETEELFDLREDELDFYDEAEDTYYSKSFLRNIVSDNGQIIGDLYGRLIDTQKLLKDVRSEKGRNFFIEMDSISQLCCNVAEFILYSGNFNRTRNILFLNRLSLNEDFLAKEYEEKALELLFKESDVVVYSFGATELDDDFPERSNEYWNEYEMMLKELGWDYDDEYEFYIKFRNV